METALLKSKSRLDLLLLLDIAKKIGMQTTILTADEIEDMGLGRAIQKGRTGEFLDEKEFMRKLKKRAE